MSPANFRAWRAALGWSQRRAAAELGLSKQMIALYERGADYSRLDEDGAPRAVVIPRVVELACAELARRNS